MISCGECGYSTKRIQGRCIKCGACTRDGAFEHFLIDDIRRFKYFAAEIRIFPSFCGSKSISHWLGDLDMSQYFKMASIPQSTDGYSVDVVVNSANNFFIHGSGFAKYLLQKLGDGYSISCEKYVKQHPNIKKGDSIFIPIKPVPGINFGIMQAVSVFYTRSACGLNLQPSNWNDIFNCVYSSLKTCDDLGYKSIAFPQMASRSGYSIYGGDAYKQMLIATYLAITNYLAVNSSGIESIYIHPTDYVAEEFFINLLEQNPV